MIVDISILHVSTPRISHMALCVLHIVVLMFGPANITVFFPRSCTFAATIRIF